MAPAISLGGSRAAVEDAEPSARFVQLREKSDLVRGRFPAEDRVAAGETSELLDDALLYRSKYGDRHLREQGSRCTSEQKLPQPRVTIGSEHDQVRSAPHGMREYHLCDRRAVRHHAFHVEMHTVPRQLQGDVGTGLFAVSAASGRINDERGDRLCVDKKRHRV